MRPRSSSVQEKVARIASAQHGVVTRAQLLAAGVSEAGIQRRVRKAVLHRVHPGVYRIGHEAPSALARYSAAVLACGHEAVLSGAAAAHLLGLVRSKNGVPEVTAPSRHRIDGVVTHRGLVAPQDRFVFRGIPVTAVPRTLVDLAAQLDEDDLARASHEAGVRYRTTPAHVERALERRPNAPGAGMLRAIMSGKVEVALSRLEHRFHHLLREHGLPAPPETNRAAGAHRVDCRWPAHRLTVELDSYRYHNSRHSWEQDRRRERTAFARGDAFRRYAWTDVFERPAPMLAELRPLLTPPPAAG